MSVLIRFDNRTQVGGPQLDADGKLETGDPLRTAVEISLFTRAADPDESRQSGWWADSYSDVPIGSKLWTLARRKIDRETLSLGKGYAVEALKWLVTDGVAKTVEAEVTRAGIDSVRIAIVIGRADGTRWEHVWEGVRLGNL